MKTVAFSNELLNVLTSADWEELVLDAVKLPAAPPKSPNPPKIPQMENEPVSSDPPDAPSSAVWYDSVSGFQKISGC